MIQPIRYRGRVVGAATATGLYLCRELACRPAGDPELTFVIYMAAYAADVLTAELPAPYSEHQARRYARAALIPEELLERPIPNLAVAARWLGIPCSELAEAVREHPLSTADAGTPKH